MAILLKSFKRLSLKVSEGLQSLREAMIWTLPCVLISAIFVAAAYFVELLKLSPDLVITLKSLSTSLSQLMPVVLSPFLTYILSVKKRLPPMPFALLALSYTLLIYLDVTHAFQKVSSFMLLVGMVIPFLTVTLLNMLYKKNGPCSQVVS